MAERKFYLLPPLNTLPVEDPYQWVGRIVKLYGAPDENFTPEKVPVELSRSVGDDPGFCNVNQIIDSQKSRMMGVLLADMLRFSASHTETAAPHVSARNVRGLKLQQEEINRQTVLALEEVKGRLKEWHSVKHHVYLVVGLLVADRVRYAEKSSTDKSKEMEAKPPSQLASLAAGSPGPSNDVVKVNLADSKTHGLGTKLTAVGQRIFAVEYTVLTKRLLSTSGKIDVRPGGVRGERTFGEADTLSAESDAKYEQSEVVADPDPLSEVMEQTEEWCFDIGDD